MKSNRRIFLTGGSGFFGNALATYWASQGHEVLATVRSAERIPRGWGKLPNIKTLIVDLENLPADFDANVARFKPDTICHSAWRGTTAAERASYDIQAAQLKVFLDLLNKAREWNVRHFIGFGSQAECTVKNEPIEESTPLIPQASYGAAKAASSIIGEAWGRETGKAYSHIRPLTVYGIGDFSDRFVPMICKAGLKKSKPELSPGEQVWDFLYIDDFVDLVDRVMHRGAEGLTVAAYGEGHRLADIARILAKSFDIEIALGARPYRPNELMRLVGNPARAKSQLGWSPKITLEEGLSKTALWWKNQRL